MSTQTMTWKCLDCRHKWALPVHDIAKACPKCGARNFIDLNLSPVSAQELAALGLPKELATYPRQYVHRAKS